MKIRIILSVIAAIMLFIASIIGWMVGTEKGNRFIITTSIKFIPAKIHIEKTSGRLIDKLRIEGISVGAPDWEIRVKSMEISLKPSYLTAGMVVFEKAVINGVEIAVLNPDDPVNIEWPNVPGWLSWVNGGIKDLLLDRLSVYSRNEKIFEANDYNGEIVWRFGSLRTKNAKIKMPFGVIEGDARAGFLRPALSANISLIFNKKIVDVERFHIEMHLKKSQKPEHVSGPVAVKVMSGKTERFLMKGDVALTNSKINFKELVLSDTGREGQAIINGQMDFASKNTNFDLKLKLAQVDLKKELSIKTSFFGIIDVAGNPSHYRGSVSVQNKDKAWKDIQLNGTFDGDMQQIQINEIKGAFLNGVLNGFLKMTWAHDFSLTAAVGGRNIDPSRIAPKWQGRINADAKCAFNWTSRNIMDGEVKAEFFKSTLRSKMLSGTLDAVWKKDVLHINNFNISGNGFHASARGVLDERLNYDGKISDFSGLFPGSKGKVSASGWMKVKNKNISCFLKGNASLLSFEGLSAESANLEAWIDEGQDIINAKLSANNAGYSSYRYNSLMVDINGKFSRHNIQAMLYSKEGSIQAYLSGGYKKGVWSGTINQLSMTDKTCGVFGIVKPSSLEISPGYLSLNNLSMTGNSKEMLEADAKIDFEKLRGYVKMKWQNINVARINPYLTEFKIFGAANGTFENEWLPEKRIKMTAMTSMNGGFIKGPVKIHIDRSSTSIKWDEKGLVSAGNIELEGGGKLLIQFSSNQPAHAGLPDYGEVKCSWNDIDTYVIKPFLPESVESKGKLNGIIAGRLKTEKQFDISGKMDMTEGRFVWKRREGRISFATERANMNFIWREAFLNGNIDLVLPSYGQMKGVFKLPIAAKIPFTLEQNSPIMLESHGKMRERGMVSAIFPGLVEETGGQVSFSMSASGTWQHPDYKGWLKLENAGAFFPVAGVHIKDMAMNAELNNDRIHISSFNAVSGKGNIQGSATAWLKNWKVDRYEGKLTGKRFQAVYIPEIQLQVNPDVVFGGNGKTISINGSVEIPEAIINQGEAKKGAIKTSPDVNIIDAPSRAKAKVGFDFDARIMVLLGENIIVKAPGIDARLEGKVLLAGRSIDRITGEGQIRIVKGQYSGYGTKLDVTRGNIVFNGKPVELASLDIMALRSINPGRFNEIKAGVIITGTPQSPLINLYSEPSMSDADILSYIVLGRPIRVEGETTQSALLLRSAGAFLAGGKTGSLQSKVMQKIGIDTFDVETKTASGAGTGAISMQGKPGMSGASYGSAAAATPGGTTMTRSLVTVGKYLAPGLYVAYGRSLFTEEYLLTTRYSFTKKVEIESKTGIETAVDLYYKIEFD